MHFLDRDAVVLDGILFVGATLWTDYLYWGSDDFVKMDRAMSDAARYMSDHRLIRVSNGESAGSRLFSPDYAAKVFEIEHSYLREILTASSDEIAERLNVDCIRKRIVVSHHLPSGRSIHPRFAHSELNPAFASHLDQTVVLVDLWVHGHTHDSFDYILEGSGGQQTRVVCNPRGYSMHERDVENTAYNPALIVEI